MVSSFVVVALVYAAGSSVRAAGDLGVLGSVANLIFLESTNREAVGISFWDYSNVGLPLTAWRIGVGWLESTCTEGLVSIAGERATKSFPGWSAEGSG